MLQIWYLFSLKFQENVKQCGVNVTFQRHVGHHPFYVPILYLHIVSAVNR